jgi:hypothetical protein
LEAAIDAHYERLKAEGVELRVPIEHLRPEHLMELPLAGAQLAGAIALITNLSAFTALRARAKIRQHRAEIRDEAQRAASDAAAEHRLEAERSAKLVELMMDCSHVERLTPALKEFEARGRTASKKLEAFHGDLDDRRRKLVRHKLPLAAGMLVDMALTRWMLMRCATLAADVEFFVGEIEGPTAMAPTGHVGAADNKAWHRVRGEALVTLDVAGVRGAQRRALLPAVRREKADSDARQRRRQRDYTATKRAKTRRISNG